MGLKISIGIMSLFLIMVGGFIYRNTHYWQKDAQKTRHAGFKEKQVKTPMGPVINYGEGPNNGPALLLIHGQSGNWEDYEKVLPKLSQNWHVFAIDCYGHGKSSHDSAKYYLKANGDDLIWFMDQVIKEKTVVSGHSSGGILAAYIAAYGGEKVIGSVLEDPPIFSTEPAYFTKSFAYQDTYRYLHQYLTETPTECWEAYYLRHCLWGQLFMKNAMPKIADYAQSYHEKHSEKPVQFFFLPPSLNFMFRTMSEYDLLFGEHFYDYTWHSGISHERLMSDIKVPTLFLHNQEQFTSDGTILMAAASNSQAEKAVALMKAGKLIETKGNHGIHRFKPKLFIEAVEEFLLNINSNK